MSWQPRRPVGVVVDALSASAQVGAPDSTRRVYAAIAAFVIIGIAMLALAVWLIRRTRPEPQLLAPLEAMEATSWRRSSAAERNRELDRLRPAGAVPLRRSTSEPDLDESFEAIAPVRNFDDLDDAGAVGLPRAERDLTPVGASALDTDSATVSSSSGRCASPGPSRRRHSAAAIAAAASASPRRSRHADNP